MKQLSLLVALTVCTIQLSFAQVKKQYKDKVFNQTTVVIKQDAANDADILNAMDLDEVGMDQVIQIKKAPTETAKLPEQKPVEELAVVNTKPVIQQVKEVTPRANASQSSASSGSTVKRGGSGNYRHISQYKAKNRRFKKVKRKKRKRSKRMRCYKF